MPATATAADLAVVTTFLKRQKLKHLRCRVRAAAVIVESGPKDDALGHVRLRKQSASAWEADEFHHSGRWAALPIHASLNDVLLAISSDFSWLLEP